MPGITNPSEEYFKDGTWGYDGTVWRKLPIVWGYHDRLAEFDTHTKVGAGSALRTLFTVPAGYIYIVNATMSINNDKIVAQNHLLYNGSNYYTIYRGVPTAVAQWMANPNVFYALKTDDKLTFQFVGCDAGDVLEFAAWGYKMKVT